MFGLFKNIGGGDEGHHFSGKFSSGQKDFLVKAEQAYCLTFKKCDMGPVSRLVTRDVYMQIYNSLTVERSWTAISDKFKTVEWSFKSGGPDCFTVVKTTVFDKVNVSRGLKLAMCDNFTEEWDVFRKKDGSFVVSKIVS